MQFSHNLDITFIQRLPQTKPINFSDLIIPLASISTMEELCYIFQHLPSFNDLTMITDINIFKHPIKPLWEDENNLAGGKYIIKVKRIVGQRLFEKLVVNFMNCDYVNGIVASIRKQQVMLSVWVRTVPTDKKMYVQRIREVLDIGYEVLIEFKDNDESLKDNSSFRNTAVFGRIEEDALARDVANLKVTNEERGGDRNTVSKQQEYKRSIKADSGIEQSDSKGDPETVHVRQKEKPLLEDKKVTGKNEHKNRFDESKIFNEVSYGKNSQGVAKGNKGYFKQTTTFKSKQKTFKSDVSGRKSTQQSESSPSLVEKTINGEEKKDGTVKSKEETTKNNAN